MPDQAGSSERAPQWAPARFGDTRTRDEIVQEMINLTPEPCRDWTWWDHAVFLLTRHVSRRVFEDRMAKSRADQRRIAQLAAELRSLDA